MLVGLVVVVLAFGDACDQDAASSFDALPDDQAQARGHIAPRDARRAGGAWSPRS
jgi:hypothetical protein